MPTNDELLGVIFEKLASIDDRQGATARAVRHLAEGLTASEKRRQDDEQAHAWPIP